MGTMGMERAFLAAALAVASTLSPIVAGAEPAEVSIWHSYRGDEKAALERMVQQYNQAFAAYHVTALAVPNEALADKITTAIPQGQGPDLFIFAHDRLGGWVQAGNIVESIDFNIDKAMRATYLPNTLDALTYQGSLYGLPLNYKSVAMIYNRKLVPTPPVNTNQLVQVCKKLSNTKEGRFGLAYEYNSYYFHAALQNGYRGGAFDAAGKPILNSPGNKHALDTVVSWVKDSILPGDPNGALITSLFNSGRAAIVFNGPWFIGEIDKSIDYAVVPMPALSDGGGAPMRPWLTVEGVFISAGSKQKDAALAFAKFITGKGAAVAMALEGHQSPASIAAYEDARVAGNATLAAFKKQAEVAVPMPNLPEMSMVWGPAGTALASALKGITPPAAALDALQAKVTAQISRPK